MAEPTDHGHLSPIYLLQDIFLFLSHIESGVIWVSDGLQELFLAHALWGLPRALLLNLKSLKALNISI